MVRRIIKTNDQLTSLKALLRECNLPWEDLTADKNILLGYYDSNDHLIASGGLEFYNTSALLRSVAVRKDFRSKSLGTQVVNDLFEKAKSHGVSALYLLTETAFDYFLKKGFQETSRDLVPEELKKSTEFSSVCPVSAKCMIYTF